MKDCRTKNDLSSLYLL